MKLFLLQLVHVVGQAEVEGFLLPHELTLTDWLQLAVPPFTHSGGS